MTTPQVLLWCRRLEITTEGDSFSIAFGSVHAAVHFCLELQYRFLDTKWPSKAMKLAGCKPVLSAEGDVIHQVCARMFRGQAFAGRRLRVVV